MTRGWYVAGWLLIALGVANAATAAVLLLAWGYWLALLTVIAALALVAFVASTLRREARERKW